MFRLFVIIILAVSQFFLGGCQKASKGNYEVYSIPGLGAYANSYVVASNGQAALIDPAQTEEIMKVLEEHSLAPSVILLTHGHFDHISGLEGLINEFPGLKIKIHKRDQSKLNSPEKNLSAMFGSPTSVAAPTEAISEGQTIKVGEAIFKVIETPGHSSGSVSYHLGDLLFSGDTLLLGSVGRTDFPDGDKKALSKSLPKLTSLPGATEVLPGHGEPTTIEEEKNNNPFL